MCDHPKLSFGSGGYYIFCNSCKARWGRLGDQPEYGYDKDGNPIGCVPHNAEFLEPNYRIKPTIQ
jgi:hypothetical protein